MFFICKKEKKRKEVLAFLYNYDQYPRHSIHVARMAVDLFNQTKSLHKLSAKYAFYLELAALLHDIGLVSGVRHHHKHSYSLIADNTFTYLSDKEKLIIAAVARYHRKAYPRNHHKTLSQFSVPDRQIITHLAAILRLADGLDSSHNQSIKKIKVNQIEPDLKLSIYGFSCSDKDISGAYKKSKLFTMLFHRNLSVYY